MRFGGALGRCPGELDRLSCMLWPSFVKVALLLVALIRKVRSVGISGDAEDPGLTAMLRAKLHVNIATIEHVAGCCPPLGAVAQILRALGSPEIEGMTQEQRNVEEEILGLFPLASASFL